MNWIFPDITLDPIFPPTPPPCLIHNLPKDAILSIFQFLSVQELGKVSLCCKRWHQLADDSFFRKKINQAFFNRFPDTCKQIEETDLDAMTRGRIYKRTIQRKQYLARYHYHKSKLFDTSFGFRIWRDFFCVKGGVLASVNNRRIFTSVNQTDSVFYKKNAIYVRSNVDKTVKKLSFSTLLIKETPIPSDVPTLPVSDYVIQIKDSHFDIRSVEKLSKPIILDNIPYKTLEIINDVIFVESESDDCVYFSNLREEKPVWKILLLNEFPQEFFFFDKYIIFGLLINRKCIIADRQTGSIIKEFDCTQIELIDKILYIREQTHFIVFDLSSLKTLNQFEIPSIFSEVYINQATNRIIGRNRRFRDQFAIFCLNTLKTIHTMTFSYIDTIYFFDELCFFTRTRSRCQGTLVFDLSDFRLIWQTTDCIASDIHSTFYKEVLRLRRNDGALIQYELPLESFVLTQDGKKS